MIDRKLQILLQRGHPYALAFMALSGTASKERLAYAVIEGAAREFLRTMNFRVGQQDACAYILQYLDKKLRPKTPAFRVRCYKETRDAMTEYLNELQGEEISRFQGVLDAWATTSDARKHITYLRTVETAARRFRKEPPKRATQKLLLVLQDEYKSSAALFEMRLKLMLACMKAVKRSMVVDSDALPDKFPTHRHSSYFWESLGRAVATFGFLEEVLGKAIFAFTTTLPYDDSEIQSAYEQWLPKLERALVDPLGGLINAYGKAVREHPGANIEDLDELLLALRKASDIRNVLCHGSWQVPNPDGASLPLYVNRRREVFGTAVDCQFLDQVQRHVAELACSVVSTDTAMGWAFPGSNGPGMPIWENRSKQDRSDS